MSVLSAYFDKSVNQCSPVVPDYARVVNYDDAGNEIVTYQEFDYPGLQDSLGSVKDWSLNSLIRAGIDPSFPIHTGFGTRIEGASSVAQMAEYANQVLSEIQAPEDLPED